MKNFFNKKTASIFSMLAVATILISSCKNDDPEPVVYGSAKIRVVNAVNGSSAQDFYQGNTKMSTTAVAYGEFSSYLTISAGNSTISFKNAGTTTTTVSQNIGAYTDASYTAFTASNSAGGVQIVGFEDDTVVPASGKAKVRFVNLGPAFNNTINVTATSGAIVTGLQLGFASAYSTVDITVL